MYVTEKCIEVNLFQTSASINQLKEHIKNWSPTFWIDNNISKMYF